MAKKLDRNSITGRQGVNLVEKFVLAMGFAWNETRMDAGIDGEIEVRDPATSAMSNRVIRVQVKSGDSYLKAETKDEFTFHPEPEDLQYWLDGNTPVILVVCRPEKEEAYWVSIQDYFKAAAPQKKAKIVFNKAAQRLTKDSGGELTKLAAPRAWGLHTPPVPQVETLYTNLLPVTKLPSHVYIAVTKYRDPKELFPIFREKKVRGFDEYLLREGNIISVHNLKEEPFKSLCDQTTVERHAFGPWADAYEMWARELMKQMLKALAYSWYLKYTGRDDLFYTLATDTGEPRQWSVQGEKKASAITVYKKYQSKLDPTRVSYHRHSGFMSQFQLYDGAWYLMLSPTYYFTSDGKKKHSKNEEMLKKMKIFERQKAVYGQLLMWSQRLQPKVDMFLPAYKFMEFGPLLKLTSPVGIDDLAWRPGLDDSAEDYDTTVNFDLG